MSRSYRKHPSCRMTLWGKHHNRSMKAGKRYANKRIRRQLKNVMVDISNGHYYKRLGIDAWDLWEFNFYKTRQDVIDECNNPWYHTGTLEEELLDWKKYYIRK